MDSHHPGGPVSWPQQSCRASCGVSCCSNPGLTQHSVRGPRKLTSSPSLSTGEGTAMLESSGRELHPVLVTQHLCPLSHQSDFPPEHRPRGRENPGAWTVQDTSHCSGLPTGTPPKPSLGDSLSSEAVIPGRGVEGQRPKSRDFCFKSCSADLPPHTLYEPSTHAPQNPCADYGGARTDP